MICKLKAQRQAVNFGIVDEVITMTTLTSDEGNMFRAFVCHTLNQWAIRQRIGAVGLMLSKNLILASCLRKCRAAPRSHAVC